jgi:hypothetical protein
VTKVKARKGLRKIFLTRYNHFFILRVRLPMLELLKSLAVAVLMVPVVMALMLGIIYGLGEVFNVISKFGHREKSSARSHN